MPNDPKPEKPGGDTWTHAPLPYVVRVRTLVGGDEDRAPTVSEHRLVAYSVLEAMVQAITELGGQGLEDSRYKIERIAPDVPAFVKSLAMEAVRTKR